jgi:hypothetical protein
LRWVAELAKRETGTAATIYYAAETEDVPVDLPSYECQAVWPGFPDSLILITFGWLASVLGA